MQIKITWGWLALLTFTFALLLVAASKVDLTTDTIIQHPTNWIDPLNVTNLFVWEAPQPSKVTIWFSVQLGNDFEPGPIAYDSVETNAYPVTASNAVVMVRERLKGQEHRMRLNSLRLTGIWRDE